MQPFIRHQIGQLSDVYKRQVVYCLKQICQVCFASCRHIKQTLDVQLALDGCLLYTSRFVDDRGLIKLSVSSGEQTEKMCIRDRYYMVPFNDKKRGCKVAQFQLGYKGYIQLAIRSGYYKKINVISIKEGELIRFDPLEEEIEVNLIEDEMEREAAPVSYTHLKAKTTKYRWRVG